MPYFKSIIAPDRGVVARKRPHLIDPRAWTVMQQMRAVNGIVKNFPGWRNILSGGATLEGFCSLIHNFVKLDGTSFLLAAGDDKIFTVSDTGTLTDVSRATPAYAVTQGDLWFPFEFADNLYLVSRAEPMQKFTGSGTFADVAGAPKARSGGILRDHICLLNVIDGASDLRQAFMWASEGSDTVWLPAITNSAGSFLLRDTPDVGVRLQRLGDDIIAYKEETLIPITYVGGVAVFERRQSVAQVGLIGTLALADRGSHHLFMGHDTFYSYAGGLYADDSVGDAIRDAVYPFLHPMFKHRSVALHMHPVREVMFLYPDVSSTGELNKAVIYHHDDRVWYGPFDIGAATYAAHTRRGATKVIDSWTEIIDTVSTLIDASGGEGSPQFLFGTTGGLVHEITDEVQSANGTVIERVLESGDDFLGEGVVDENNLPVSFPPGTVFKVTSINLEVEDTGASENIQFFLGRRMKLNDPIVYDGPFTIKSDGSQPFRIPDLGRASGRWFRRKFVIPASAQLNLAGVQYELEVEGRR